MGGVISEVGIGALDSLLKSRKTKRATRSDRNDLVQRSSRGIPC